MKRLSLRIKVLRDTVCRGPETDELVPVKAGEVFDAHIVDGAHLVAARVAEVVGASERVERGSGERGGSVERGSVGEAGAE